MDERTRFACQFPDAATDTLTASAQLSVLALAAYPQCVFERECVQKACEEAGGKFTSWKRNNAVGIMCEMETGIYVAISGTKGRADANTDLDLASTTLANFTKVHGFDDVGYGDERVHCGFATYAGLCLRAIREQSDLDHPLIYLVGHSLGGAAATLLPRMSTPLSLAHVVSYGAPRTHRKGQRARRANVTRIASIYDLVPDVPRLCYQHVCPDALYIRYAGSVSARRRWYAWLRRYLFYALWYHNPLGGSVAAHSMAQYAKDLRPLR